MNVVQFQPIGRSAGRKEQCAIDQWGVGNQRKLHEPDATLRPRVHGKFLYIGERHFWIRGVTYGTFRPDELGGQFPDKDTVEQDFRAIAHAGLNSVRVYTTPPRWLLDLAAACGLRVTVGLPWEQHIAFLDDRARVRRILDNARASVSALAGHPATLCYVLGNEIPASIVRWYGKSRIERFIRELYVVIGPH